MKNRFNVPLVRLFGIIALVAVIGFSMAACDDGSADNGGGGGGSVSVPETNVQVYNKDGTPYTSSGTVKYRLMNKTIDAGIVTDGKLTLSLPPSGSTGTHLLNDSLRLYPVDIKLSYKGQTGNKSYEVSYVYSETDYKRNDTDPYGLVYQIDIKAGWVKILTINEKTSSTTTKLTVTSNLSGIPSDMKWTLNN
jgi:hypothetical protein